MRLTVLYLSDTSVADLRPPAAARLAPHRWPSPHLRRDVVLPTQGTRAMLLHAEETIGEDGRYVV